ncbi:MAG: metallophosphoesterase [Acidobacteriota bacterium]|nr:metallophosphoesterase [Acidobacteriota bacterium]
MWQGVLRTCVLAAAGIALLCASKSGGAGGDFRFAILGDRTGETQPGVYEQIWREVNAWRPDIVINVGDSIQGGNDATAREEWSALQPLLARYRQYPLYFTPGNHDIWSEKSRRIYIQETKRPTHYSFDFGSAHFTVLDNSETEGLSGDEMQFLAADLEKHQDRPLKLVFFHRPFWLIPVMLGGDFPLRRLAVKYHVQYVVSGHAHKFTRFEQAGVTYLMVGSSGGHLRGKGFEDGWFFHHVQATVKGGKIQMTIQEVGPPLGKGRSFTEQEWGSGPVMSKPDRPSEGAK